MFSQQQQADATPYAIEPVFVTFKQNWNSLSEFLKTNQLTDCSKLLDFAEINLNTREQVKEFRDDQLIIIVLKERDLTGNQLGEDGFVRRWFEEMAFNNRLQQVYFVIECSSLDQFMRYPILKYFIESDRVFKTDSILNFMNEFERIEELFANFDDKLERTNIFVELKSCRRKQGRSETNFHFLMFGFVICIVSLLLWYFPIGFENSSSKAIIVQPEKILAIEPACNFTEYYQKLKTLQSSIELSLKEPKEIFYNFEEKHSTLSNKIKISDSNLTWLLAQKKRIEIKMSKHDKKKYRTLSKSVKKEVEKTLTRLNTKLNSTTIQIKKCNETKNNLEKDLETLLEENTKATTAINHLTSLQGYLKKLLSIESIRKDGNCGERENDSMLFIESLEMVKKSFERTNFKKELGEHQDNFPEYCDSFHLN